MRPRFLCLLLLSWVGLFSWAPGAGLAQVKDDPRSTFPGRRVGGGTRGECTSRQIVHLVPESSVFAPGESRLLAVLTGASPQPRPLQLSFQPRQAGATAPAPAEQRLLPADPDAALLLVRSTAVVLPTVWESSFVCGTSAHSQPHTADPLGLAVGIAPPAESLLLPPRDSTAADLAWQAKLKQLQSRCGGTVGVQELASIFGLAELHDGWPAQLPVRCPAS